MRKRIVARERQLYRVDFELFCLSCEPIDRMEEKPMGIRGNAGASPHQAQFGFERSLYQFYRYGSSGKEQ